MEETKADQDENRTAELERFGIRVVRLTKNQIIHSLKVSKQTILQKTNSPSP